MRWEQTDAHRMWRAGDPVLLSTDSHEHVAYVRLTHGNVRPRWLKPGPQWRVHPCELTLRDPRELWCNAWELQLAVALLSAPCDGRLAWLRDLDPELEPDLCELRDLAQQELRAVLPPAGPAGATTPATGEAAPPAQRGWLRAERDAMRIQASAAPELVNLAPGR